ncbi:hypothetical protein CP979_36095 [Streptomyces filamentosus]|nr:hypothetical protein CP979_36095 [Streptomyces filamentosus]
MVTGPSSNPSGERAPRPGVTWQTTIGWTGERLVADDEPEPRPNRATRRALARRTETFDHEPMTSSPTASSGRRVLPLSHPLALHFRHRPRPCRRHRLTRPTPAAPPPGRPHQGAP